MPGTERCGRRSCADATAQHPFLHGGPTTRRPSREPAGHLRRTRGSGTGYISACPDPDGAGPEFFRLRDLNGDGRNDSCFPSSYQNKNAAGDDEYHVRVNNIGDKGEQQVNWGRDDDGDGRIDSRDDDDITIDRFADGKDGDRDDSW